MFVRWIVLELLVVALEQPDQNSTKLTQKGLRGCEGLVDILPRLILLIERANLLQMAQRDLRQHLLSAQAKLLMVFSNRTVQQDKASTELLRLLLLLLQLPLLGGLE